jgi:hypothetical protein
MVTLAIILFKGLQPEPEELKTPIPDDDEYLP